MIPNSLKQLILVLACALLLTNSAAAVEGKIASESDFAAANEALRSKNYSAAIELYERIAKSTSDESLQRDSTFWKSEALFLSGDVTRATQGFQAYAERNPKQTYTAAAYNRLGDIALDNSESAQAIEFYCAALDHASDGIPMVQARLGLARALLIARRLDEVAIAVGRLTSSSNPDVVAEALILVGRAKYEAGQYDLALSTFRRIYELPADAHNINRGRLAAGWSLWKLSRAEDVAEEIAPLAKDSQSETQYRYLLGMAAHSLKDWPTAGRELAEAANSTSPNRAAALFYLGDSLLHEHKYKDAKRVFDRLTKEEANSDWADDGAWGLARTARLAKSKADFDAACQLLKDRYPQSDYVAQIALLAAGKTADFTTIDDGFELFEEAVGHERDGEYDAALATYHEFLAKKPAKSWLAEGLWRTARLHERLKQHRESRQYYERLLQETPEFDRAAEVMANLARFEAEEGNQVAASKQWQELLSKFPQSSQAADAAYWLALAAADDNKSDLSRKYVDWLLEHQQAVKKRTGLWEQTLCLQCQLLADGNDWQGIIDLLEGFAPTSQKGNLVARLSFWRAEAALRLDHEDARQRFESLETVCVGISEPWVPMIALRRAQIAARREDWQEVLEFVEELERRYPEFELAYECDYLRGRALAGRGEMSAARVAYGQVLANDWAAGTETAAMAEWMIGETHFHQRNYELAKVAYQRVIERHSLPEWQARAALQAGKCAELLENWGDATNLYAQALERWPDTTLSKQLTARLQWTEERVAEQAAIVRR